HALAEKLLRSGGNVTLVVDNLEKRGWVRRVRLTEDRRMVKIHLTPEGKRLIARVFPQHLKALVAEMSRLSATEQENLRDICRKLGRVALPSADGQRKKADSEKEVRHDSGSTE
ncbi:MAG TPA: MarR family transcriptional regulator, partial [Candidatus Acidoferrum sp.]|nr:MarR family transcriptional regulator [Candidatus Acidoferrum sp.]